MARFGFKGSHFLGELILKRSDRKTRTPLRSIPILIYILLLLLLLSSTRISFLFGWLTRLKIFSLRCAHSIPSLQRISDCAISSTQRVSCRNSDCDVDRHPQFNDAARKMQELLQLSAIYFYSHLPIINCRSTSIQIVEQEEGPLLPIVLLRF